MPEGKKPEIVRLLGEQRGQQVQIVPATIQKVFERSMTDPEFRRLAIKDPGKAVAEYHKEPLPKNLKFMFVDNSGPDKTLTYLLPDPLPISQLTESDLAAVAGGVGRASPDSNNNVSACCFTV